MREVLLVYQQVALQNQNGVLAPLVITLSVDEKPGWQALENTAPDRCLAATPPWGGIMSTSDWERARFWLPWTCTADMSPAE